MIETSPSIVLSLVLALLAGVSQVACTAGEAPISDEVTVYKTSTCPCCEGWIAHMQREGFRVTSENRDEDIDHIKELYGISDSNASCHTARVGGYTIEGHVPAEDVRRLLKEKPDDIVGLTAPGMPMQSPGMQPEGMVPKNFDVVAIKKDGSTEVYHRY